MLKGIEKSVHSRLIGDPYMFFFLFLWGTFICDAKHTRGLVIITPERSAAPSRTYAVPCGARWARPATRSWTELWMGRAVARIR